jgi:small subunit ribosomal protein S1
MRRVRDLQPYVGKELEAKIIELDKNRNNVVLSRRAWLEQTQSEVRSDFLTRCRRVRSARRRVLDRQLRCVRGPRRRRRSGARLELSWKHIDHPSEVVEVGQEVTVEVSTSTWTASVSRCR